MAELGIQDRSVLVIGAGLVGTAVVRRLAAAGVRSVGIHCRRAESLARARSRLDDCPGFDHWRWSSGDLFVPLNPLSVDGVIVEAGVDAQACRARLLRLPRWSDSHRLERLAEDYDVIVDCTNVATTLSDPRSYPEIAAGCSCKASDACALCGGVFLGSLRHYGVALDRILRGTRRRFVKVSTTGLGAMGLEVPFTHGDPQAEVMSSALWRKLELAGALHNMLWATSRSFSERVSLIVPAACVGFPREEAFMHLEAGFIDEATGEARACAGSGFSARGMWLGEDRLYSHQEMLLLSSRFMMGGVRAEDVAQTILDRLEGDKTADVLNAMSRASLRPSNAGAAARLEAGEWLSARASASGPVALGALGPFVVKLLLELDLVSGTLRRVPLDCADACDPAQLAARCSQQLLQRPSDLGVLARMKMQVGQAPNGSSSHAPGVDLSVERIRATLAAARAAVKLGRLPSAATWDQCATGDLCAALLAPVLPHEAQAEEAAALRAWALDR